MQRNEWKFEYQCRDLVAAAAAKKAHHEQRLAWWEEKQRAVIEEVKTRGLEVSESIAMQYQDSKAFIGSSALRGAQLTVKNDYQVQLNECHTKISQHGNRAKEYDAWMQMLSARPDNHVTLDNEDWMFFFGK